MSKRNQKLLCGILIALNLSLIWGNSMMTGDDSGAMSDWVMDLLSFLPHSELAHTVLRKLAHFSEFACLGLLISWMSLLQTGKIRFPLLALGLAAGCVDETIQIFVPGRASSLIDVWIDTAGFAAGLTLLALGHTILKRRKTLEEIKS